MLLSFKNCTQTQKNSYIGIVYSIINVFLSFLSIKLYVLFLGNEQYGLWGVFSGIESMFFLADFGLSSSIIKFVAPEENRNEVKVTKVFSNSCYIVTGVTFVFIIVLFFNKVRFLHYLNINYLYIEKYSYLVPCIGILALAVLISNLVQGVIRGLNRLDISYILLTFAKIIQILIVIIFISKFQLYSLFFSQFFSVVIITLISIVLIYKKYGINLLKFKRFDVKMISEIVNFSKYVFGSSLFNLFLDPFNKMMITKHLSLEMTGYYQFISSVVLTIRNLFLNAAYTLYPKIASLTNEKNSNKMFDIIKEYYKNVRFKVILLYIISCLFFPIALKIYFGQIQFKLVAVYGILCLGYIFNNLTMPHYYLLLGVGKPNITFNTHLIQSILNFVFVNSLVIFFINKIDLISFSIAISFGLIIASVYLIIEYLKYVNNFKI